LLEPVFGDATGEVEILRVRKDGVSEGLRAPIAAVGVIALGGRGQPYLGSGWVRSHGPTPGRLLPAGGARLYLPFEKDTASSLTLELPTPQEAEELRVDGAAIEVPEDSGEVSASLAPRAGRRLHAVEVQWRASTPLAVIGIRMTTP
jgi:hypothetical protein